MPGKMDIKNRGKYINSFRDSLVAAQNITMFCAATSESLNEKLRLGAYLIKYSDLFGWFAGVNC